MPETDAPEAHTVELDRIAVGFARLLRGAGLDVPLGNTIAFGQALMAVGLERRDSVYWAGRTTLVRRPEDADTYDRAFRAWWEHEHDLELVPPPVTRELSIAFDAGGDDDAPESGETTTTPTVAVRYSAAEVLRQRDFASYTAAEFAEARRLMADLRLAGSMRDPAVSSAAAAIGASPISAGRCGARSVPAASRFSAPFSSLRRGRAASCSSATSVGRWSRMRALVRFLHAAVVGRGRVEAFAMGTRLTRITRELSSRDPDAAIAAAAHRVVDWSGGTRLGEALREFNDRWGVRGMARGRSS